MIAIDVETAVRNCYGIVLLHPERSIDSRYAPGDRGRGASEHRKPQFARDIHHPLCLPKIPREMLIVEYRNRSSGLPEDVGDFEEHLKPGVKLLLFVVRRIFPMFTDQK